VGGEPGEVGREDVEGAVPVDGDCGAVEVGKEDSRCADLRAGGEVGGGCVGDRGGDVDLD
jgi:hypothetical protein